MMVKSPSQRIVGHIFFSYWLHDGKAVIVSLGPINHALQINQTIKIMLDAIINIVVKFHSISDGNPE